MMKAPPKFETCLFGPSGKPIPIKAYYDDSSEEEMETTEVVNIVSDPKEGNVVVIGSDGGGPRGQYSNGGADDLNDKDHDVRGGPHQKEDEDSTLKNDCDDANPKSPEQSDKDDRTSILPLTPTKSISPQSKQPPARPAKVIARTQSESSTTYKSNKATPTNQQPKQKATPIMPSTKTTYKKSQQNSNNHHHTINLQELRRLSSQGVPDECTYRPLAWRILLGYLPLDTTKWQAVLDKDRLLYRTLIKELFVYSKDHDYPFELEGRKLIGKGLNNDGRRMDGETSEKEKMKNWKNRYGERGDSASNNSSSIGRNESISDATAKENENGNQHITDANSSEVNMNDMNNESVEVNEEGTLSEKGENENRHQSLSSSFSQSSSITSEQPNTQTEEIPQAVKEQWRKSGRDPDALLAGMGKIVSGRFVNALLVTNNDTACTKSNDVVVVEPELYDHDDEQHRNLYISKSLEGDYDPKWRHFLENASLLDEIRKDVVRTHPDLRFFLEPKDNLGSRRYAAIERILFVWAKLNKGVRLRELCF